MNNKIIAILAVFLIISSPVSAVCLTYKGAQDEVKKRLYPDIANIDQLLPEQKAELESVLIEIYKKAIKDRYPEISSEQMDAYLSQFDSSKKLSSALNQLRSLETDEYGKSVGRDVVLQNIRSNMGSDAKEEAPSMIPEPKIKVEDFDSVEELEKQLNKIAFYTPDEYKDNVHVNVRKNAKKIVTIGDAHGDYDTTVALLQRSGIIDKDLNWIAPSGTQLVFMGDYIDRGPKSLDVLDLVISLQKQAKTKGSEVQALMGNHEALFLKFYEQFKDIPQKNVEGALYNKNFGWGRIGVGDNYDSLIKKYGSWEAAVEGFERDGYLAFMQGLSKAVIIDNYFFTHGGPVFGITSIKELEEHFTQLFEGENHWTYTGDLGVDTRAENDYSMGYASEWMDDQKVDAFLDNLGVDFIAVGHEPTSIVGNRIVPEEGVIKRNNRVLRTDTGMTPRYGGKGGVLVIDPLSDTPIEAQSTKADDINLQQPGETLQDILKNDVVDIVDKIRKLRGQTRKPSFGTISAGAWARGIRPEGYELTTPALLESERLGINFREVVGSKITAEWTRLVAQAKRSRLSADDSERIAELSRIVNKKLNDANQKEKARRKAEQAQLEEEQKAREEEARRIAQRTKDINNQLSRILFSDALEGFEIPETTRQQLIEKLTQHLLDNNNIRFEQVRATLVDALTSEQISQLSSYLQNRLSDHAYTTGFFDGIMDFFTRLVNDEVFKEEAKEHLEEQARIEAERQAKEKIAREEQAARIEQARAQLESEAAQSELENAQKARLEAARQAAEKEDEAIVGEQIDEMFEDSEAEKMTITGTMGEAVVSVAYTLDDLISLIGSGEYQLITEYDGVSLETCTDCADYVFYEAVIDGKTSAVAYKLDGKTVQEVEATLQAARNIPSVQVKPIDVPEQDLSGIARTAYQAAQKAQPGVKNSFKNIIKDIQKDMKKYSPENMPELFTDGILNEQGIDQIIMDLDQSLKKKVRTTKNREAFLASLRTALQDSAAEQEKAQLEARQLSESPEYVAAQQGLENRDYLAAVEKLTDVLVDGYKKKIAPIVLNILTDQVKDAQTRLAIDYEKRMGQRPKTETDSSRASGFNMPLRDIEDTGQTRILNEDQILVGGDGIILTTLPDRSTLQIVVDGMNHGLQAAQVKAEVLDSIDKGLRKGRQIGDILREINDRIEARYNVFSKLGRSADISFTTINYIRATEEGIIETIVGADRPTLIVDIEGNIREISTAIPLGIVKSKTDSYQITEDQLDPGDKVISLTDGIVEITNAAGEEFGWERVKQVIKDNRKASPKDIIRRIKEAAVKFVHGRDILFTDEAQVDSMLEEIAQDDITISAFEYKLNAANLRPKEKRLEENLATLNMQLRNAEEEVNRLIKEFEDTQVLADSPDSSKRRVAQEKIQGLLEDRKDALKNKADIQKDVNKLTDELSALKQTIFELEKREEEKREEEKEETIAETEQAPVEQQPAEIDNEFRAYEQMTFKPKEPIIRLSNQQYVVNLFKGEQDSRWYEVVRQNDGSLKAIKATIKRIVINEDGTPDIEVERVAVTKNIQTKIENMFYQGTAEGTYTRYIEKYMPAPPPGEEPDYMPPKQKVRPEIRRGYALNRIKSLLIIGILCTMSQSKWCGYNVQAQNEYMNKKDEAISALSGITADNEDIIELIRKGKLDPRYITPRIINGINQGEIPRDKVDEEVAEKKLEGSNLDEETKGRIRGKVGKGSLSSWRINTDIRYCSRFGSVCKQDCKDEEVYAIYTECPPYKVCCV